MGALLSRTLLDSKLDTRTLTVSLLLIAITCIGNSLYRRRLWPRPPGPPRVPILGNILQHPIHLQFLQYTQWAKEYGPVFSLDLLGRHVVVLNTYNAAAEFFDRDSSVYNDRPRLIMMNEILGGGVFMSVLKYGDVWRRLRRAAHEGFNSRAIEKYQGMQSKTIALALLRIAVDPKSWEHTVEWFAASSIFSALYDWPPLEPHASLIRQTADFMARMTNAASPGTFLVEFFPIMKSIPSYIAKWKREGLAWHEMQSKSFEECAIGVANKIDRGERPTGFVAGLLSARNQLSRREQTWLPGVMATAAIETTTATIRNFVVAMLHYPEVMRKAHAELDTVVGRERIPRFEDRHNLPYIQAIIRETLRWRPVAPLGLPHFATEGAWHAGYFIPKGTIVIGNIWAMNRDPSVHEDPDLYSPDRFLDASGNMEVVPPDTHQIGHASFGFGRRICAGMYFAEQELWIAIATLLWTFELRPPIDDKDNMVLPPLDEWVDSGATICSPPFACEFSLRFAEARAILDAVPDII